MPGKTKKRSAPKGKSSSSVASSSSSGPLKRRKLGSGRAAKALAAAEARSKHAINRLGDSGVVSSQRPGERRLEIGATTAAIACDNQNVTKKAGKGKVRHLFVLPGHLDLLRFASSVRAKRKTKSGAGKPQEIGTAAASGSATSSLVGSISPGLGGPEGVSNLAGRAGVAGAMGVTSETCQVGKSTSASAPAAPDAQDLLKTMDSFGAVAELGSGKPVLYIDVPTHGGRIKLCGTIVYPDAPLLTLQLPPASSKSNNILCDNVFDNMVVFDNVSWVANKDVPAHSSELNLELDKTDLQKEREKFSARRMIQDDDME